MSRCVQEAANKFNLRTTDTPTGDPYLNTVQSRQGDFRIWDGKNFAVGEPLSWGPKFLRHPAAGELAD